METKALQSKNIFLKQDGSIAIFLMYLAVFFVLYNKDFK